MPDKSFFGVRIISSRPMADLLVGVGSPLIYAEHLDASGADVFEHACELRLEGIVSKRTDAVYRSGVTANWLKLKCIKSDTFSYHRVRGDAWRSPAPNCLSLLSDGERAIGCSTPARRALDIRWTRPVVSGNG
jgi:hypothetical protein